MSQPDLKPLSAGELDDFERALLESVAGDAAPDEGRKGTLAALGLSATAPAPRPRSLGKKLWSDLSKTKLVALGIVALGSGLAVSKFAGHGAPAVASATSAIEAPREEPSAIASEHVIAEAIPSARLTPEPVPDPIAAGPTTTPKVTPSARRAASEPRRAGEAASSASTTSAPDSTSSLTREIAAIEAARSELSRGRTSATLTRLDAYDKEFPRGAFSVEVAALRIEALSREGRAAEVERLAAAFLSAYPTGIYTRRVEEARARAQSGKPENPAAPDAPGRGEH